jgi:phospholipid/cholesterol/gamma-HCH transport system substrate-binding protein
LILGDSSAIAMHKDTLKGSLALGLTESIKQEIEPLKAKTSELFSTLDSMMLKLNRALQDPRTKEIPELFSNIQQTLRNLQASTGNFSQVMSDGGPRLVEVLANAQSISENLKANNQKISAVIGNFESISDSLKRANIGATVIKVNKAVAGLQQLVEDVNQGKGSLGKLTQTDALHNQLVDASKSLNLLIDDINQNPKKYVHFSMIGRKDADGFSDKELEQIRTEINKIKIEEKKP